MKRLTMIIALSFATSTYAVQSGSGKIKTLQNAYGGWIFSIDHSNNNPETCKKAAFKLDPSIGGQYKEVYSLLLSAYSVSKPVVIFTNGCDSNGYNKFSGIYTSWGK
ncbi:hypothetical protein AADZ84_12600 [Colwelliaceae bacterium MEBiC 14330]